MSNDFTDDKDILPLLEENYKKHIKKINEYLADDSEYYVSDIEKFADLLLKKKYVIKENNAFNRLQLAVVVSLINNYKKTLKMMEKNKASFFIDDNFDLVKEIRNLKLSLINVLKKNKFTLNNKYCKNFNNGYYDIFDGIPLIVSLANDYKSTIDSLANSEEKVYSSKWSKDSQEKFKSVLLKNNFVIENSYEFTHDYNMVSVSLINDFPHTMEKLNFNVFNEIRSNTTYLNYIIEHLKNKNYVVNRDDMKYFEKFPEILLVSLENNYKKTVNVLSKLDLKTEQLDRYVDQLSDSQVIRLYNVLKFQNDDFARKLNYSTKINMNNAMWRGAASGEDIVHRCEVNGYPLNYLSSGIISDKGVLTAALKNDEIVDFVINEIDSKSVYTRENELKLLKYLHSNCDTLEDYYVSIQNKYRSEMSVLEVYGLAYYSKKTLYNNGVDKPYSITTYDYDKDTLGSCNDEVGKIRLYNHDVNARVMLKALNHECAHAVMFELINNQEYEIDEEIEIYYKDKALRFLLGNKYYDANYNCVSYEFDAEFRALCMDSKLFGEDKLNKKVDELYNSMKDENIEYAKEHIDYVHGNYREHNGKSYHINELFIETLKNASYDDVKYICDCYPCLHMDYDVKLDEKNREFTVERKNFEKVLDEALACRDSKKKANYFKLIIRRCDQSTEDLCEVNCEENIYILLKKAREHPELRSVYERAVERNNDKYAKYREKGVIKHAKV